MSDPTMPVFVPYKTLEALGEFTGNWWSDTFAMEPFILEAIENYIKAPPAQQQQPGARSEAGYQWKQVFLPEGTTLRACFDKQPYYATVEGAQIKYGEHAVSPSCFANLHGSGNRNAWKAIWLRLPGSDEWLLADVHRSARKAAIARLIGDAARADCPPRKKEKLPPARKPARRAPGTERAGSEKRLGYSAQLRTRQPPSGETPSGQSATNLKSATVRFFTSPSCRRRPRSRRR